MVLEAAAAAAAIDDCKESDATIGVAINIYNIYISLCLYHILQ
jgi:hypothetical protein